MANNGGGLLLNTPITYNDNGGMVDVLDIIATRQIVAMPDEVSAMGQDLFLGASKNVLVEASEGMMMKLGMSNQLIISDHGDAVSLMVSAESDTTILSSESKQLVMTTGDNCNLTLRVGATTLSQSNEYQMMTTSMNNGFYFDNSAVVSGGMTVGGNIFAYSNVYCQNYNVYKFPGSNESNVMFTGFALTVNDVDQLEIIKHTSFSNGNSTKKRVAVFGIKKHREEEASDTGYDLLDNIRVPLEKIKNQRAYSNVIGVVGNGSGANGMVTTGNLVDTSVTSTKLANNSVVSDKINNKAVTTVKLDDNAVTTDKLAKGAVTNAIIDRKTVGVFDVGSASNMYYSGGNIGMGTTEPSQQLHVVGNIYYTGQLMQPSDERIKTNFEVIDSALDKVLAIRGYTYLRVGQSEREVGVKAQEVQKVLPEVVKADVDGGLSVSYPNMIALLIEAIRELATRVR